MCENVGGGVFVFYVFFLGFWFVYCGFFVDGGGGGGNVKGGC
jgi:hypothetical protein